ncbi:hypothetical protein C7212DRAFT_324108 [Tuber magnatum]|uniref:Uncharacterized protein n=1 Tax=Tuber magnatum TaxID=42249 RepID=A0A317SMM3_9PEZI|nr:hypothetical protein C7212DRAFT_324108 [Tuber magnatum]
MIEAGTSPSTYWTILRHSDERAKKLLSREFRDVQREVNGTESVLGTYFVTFHRIMQ